MTSSVSGPEIGVLALQGDFLEHAMSVDRAGGVARLVKRPADLAGLRGLIIPGGESTVMSRLMAFTGLDKAVTEAADSGLPIFGTCAGLIVMSDQILDGEAGQTPLRLLACQVRRNAYGSQLNSSHREVVIQAGDYTDVYAGHFIRAPHLVGYSEEVEVLARTRDGSVVGIRDGNRIGITFHPELVLRSPVHDWFVSCIAQESFPARP